MSMTFFVSETQTSRFSQIIEDGLNWIGTIETLYGVICFVVLFLFFWWSVAVFQKRVNSISLRQILVFKRNKKYKR